MWFLPWFGGFDEADDDYDRDDGNFDVDDNDASDRIDNDVVYDDDDDDSNDSDSDADSTYTVLADGEDDSDRLFLHACRHGSLVDDTEEPWLSPAHRDEHNNDDDDDDDEMDSVCQPTSRSRRLASRGLLLACQFGHDHAALHLLASSSSRRRRARAAAAASPQQQQPQSQSFIDLNATDREGYTALMYAAQNHRLAVVQALLAREDVQVNFTKRYDLDAAAHQLFRKDVLPPLDLLRCFVEHPAVDINLGNRNEDTILHKAVALSLEAHFPPSDKPGPKTRAGDDQPSSSPNPLNQDDSRPDQPDREYVVRRQHDALVSYLLSRSDLDVNAHNACRQTALHTAAEAGHWNLIRLLLEHERCKPLLPSRHGHLFVHAALNGRAASRLTATVVRDWLSHVPTPGLLLQFANPRGGRTLLLEVLLASQIPDRAALVHLLLSHDAVDVNVRDKQGKTALHYAVETGDVAVLADVLAHPRLQILRCNHRGETALHLATLDGWFPAVRMLLERCPALLNFPNNRHETPLHHAIFQKNKDSSGLRTNKKYPQEYVAIVEFLLQQDCIEVNTVDLDGETILHDVAQTNSVDPEIVRLLLAHPHIHPNLTRRRGGDTALHIAAENESPWFEALLGHPRTDMNVYNHELKNPLHKALKRVRTYGTWNADRLEKHEARLLLLLQYPALDVNAQDIHGDTALHMICRGKFLKATKWLLKHPHIDVFRKNRHGETPLHSAVRGGHLEVIQLVLKQCTALLNIPNNSRQTPLHYSISNMDIAEWTRNMVYSYRYPEEDELLKVLQLLLQQEALHINAQDVHGDTALYRAIAVRCSPRVVFAMLDHPRIRVSLTNQIGQDAVGLASARTGVSVEIPHQLRWMELVELSRDLRKILQYLPMEEQHSTKVHNPSPRALDKSKVLDQKPITVAGAIVKNCDEEYKMSVLAKALHVLIEWLPRDRSSCLELVPATPSRKRKASDYED